MISFTFQMERNNEEVSDFDESESSSVASTRNTTEGTTTTTTENNDENVSIIVVVCLKCSTRLDSGSKVECNILKNSAVK